ncbi:hypothetical protein ILYODFUR_022099 [Ilyodon furcidens]|uniref:Uncharacterized protein n=1 Tax=Ilyodon furcidens TaxID=33524 RepID=A0ABV0UBL4_9TELE
MGSESLLVWSNPTDKLLKLKLLKKFILVLKGSCQNIQFITVSMGRHRPEWKQNFLKWYVPIQCLFSSTTTQITLHYSHIHPNVHTFIHRYADWLATGRFGRLSALSKGTSTCGRRKLESNQQLSDFKTTTVPTEPQLPHSCALFQNWKD